jgi:penicillin-binding protein 1C
MRKVKTLIFILCGSVAAGLVAGYLLTPSLDDIRQRALSSDRAVYAQKGQLLQTIRKDLNSRRLPWLELSQFSKTLQQAVLLAEDKRFYSHIGVDFVALIRASFAMASGEKVQGASTLTMQLTDLIRPEVLSGKERIVKGRIARKLAQVVKALFLELRLSKAQILEAYLNLIHLRGEHQGVHTFSHAYYKMPATNLDERKSAVVAALIASPNTSKNNIKDRACGYLKKLKAQLNALSLDCDQQFSKDLEEALRLEGSFVPESLDSAPHLARLVSDRFPNRDSYQTTIDKDLQESVAKILFQNVHRLQSRNVNDAAAIVVDLQTREVKAYVGAVEQTSKFADVDGVLGSRQAGSTLKPFIYGRAIDKGVYLPSTVLKDDRTAISWDGGVYRPSNYANNFYGLVSVREALASSLNIPAVKAVVALGLRETYSLMKSLQFRSFKGPNHYGASMALGAVDVQLETLARAYMMLARGGKLENFIYLKGQRESSDGAPQILSEQAAYIIGNILSDAKARSLGFGVGSVLETPFWTAVKTGTSKDYRDNWCVGFSERYLVGVWVGNFDSAKMKKVSGVSGAGPSWSEIMRHLHRDKPPRPPKMPKGLVTKEVKLPWAQTNYEEVYLKEHVPKSDLRVQKDVKARFAFPANNSVLVRDPHKMKQARSVFVRMTGTIPDGANFVLNGKALGPATSPFQIKDIQPGKHQLQLIAKNKENIAQVEFILK